jgi:trehalose-phosphatase
VSTAEHWRSLARHAPLGILVDLDGTLIPFADRPEDARPGRAHLALLRDLARAPGVSIGIVSGRPRESLESLFAEAPGVWLAAEHGGWLRGDTGWQAAAPAGPFGITELASALEAVAARHDGAWVERKTWSACLHYRGVRAEEKARLVAQAGAAFDVCTGSRRGYETLEGADTFEVRPAGIRKSAAIPWIRAKAGPSARLLAIGDDPTDEDMFRALGAEDASILVCRDPVRATSARWRLPDPHATVALLRSILAARILGTPPSPEILPSCIRAG